MKLVRYGNPGKEKPGLIDAEGKLRDLSAIVQGPRSRRSSSMPPCWRRSARPSWPRLPLVKWQAAHGLPGRQRRQVHRHRPELQRTTPPNRACRCPKEPVVFMKATSCIQGPDDDGHVAQGLGQGRLGGGARHRHRHAARATCRKKERARRTWPATARSTTSANASTSSNAARTWDKGKGCDTFGPARSLAGNAPTRSRTCSGWTMWLDVNGERMQTGSTKTMIFTVAHLVSYVSQFMTLLPGDVITTGTPPGVGMGMKPPQVPEEGRRHDPRHPGPRRTAPGSSPLQALIGLTRPQASRTSCRFANPLPGATPAARQSRFRGVSREGHWF
jgi:2,4-diketo-3-deoxy-L-fuconate hydrolase